MQSNATQEGKQTYSNTWRQITVQCSSYALITPLSFFLTSHNFFPSFLLLFSLQGTLLSLLRQTSLNKPPKKTSVQPNKHLKSLAHLKDSLLYNKHKQLVFLHFSLLFLFFSFASFFTPRFAGCSLAPPLAARANQCELATSHSFACPAW